MRSPFPRPSLQVFATSARNADAIAKTLALFVGGRLPHRFGRQDTHVVRSALDVYDVLDGLAPAALRHCTCVVDLSGAKTEALFSMPIRSQPLEALTLPLKYPEVFWIFLVEAPPALDFATEQDPIGLHWCRFDDLQKLLAALRRHGDGLRTWFDATELRCRSTDAIRSAEKKLPTTTHSAPFWAQTIASVLLRRATEIRRGHPTSEDAVLGATLALDAWRLLEGQTLALCLEALKLVHEFEVLAECSFVGTAAGLHVQRRFANLEAMVDTIRPAERVHADRNRLTPRCEPLLAAAIDEEERYVVFNAYLLYRRGFCTYTVPSAAELGAVAAVRGVPLAVVLEDVDLQFADGDVATGTSLSSGEDAIERTLLTRATEHPALWRVRARVFVSSLNPADPKVSKARAVLEDALAQLRPPVGPRPEERPRFGFVTKPHGGVFDPDIDAELAGVNIRSQPAVAHEGAAGLGTSRSAGHVPQNRVASRSDSIGHDHKWRRQRLHALMTCADGLVNIYRSYNQYQESEGALNELRVYEAAYALPAAIADFFLKSFQRARRIRAYPQAVWLARVCGFLSACGMAYATTLIRSLLTLLVATLGWVVVFAVFLRGNCFTFWGAFEYMATLFLELQPPTLIHGQPGKLVPCEIHPEGGHILVWLALLVAYLHLGILISLLVDRVIRRT